MKKPGAGLLLAFYSVGTVLAAEPWRAGNEESDDSESNTVKCPARIIVSP